MLRAAVDRVCSAFQELHDRSQIFKLFMLGIHNHWISVYVRQFSQHSGAEPSKEVIVLDSVNTVTVGVHTHARLWQIVVRCCWTAPLPQQGPL